jgi:hypothetical protein
MLKTTSLLMFFSLALIPQTVFADDYVISVKDHQFAPKDLAIPVGKKVKITIKNLDATPIEFESHALNREKVIAAKKEGVVFVGPLDKGTYPYFDEFNPKATGTITAQ